MARIAVPLSSLIFLLTAFHAADAQYAHVYVIHGVGETCASIGGLDRALTSGNDSYFDHWNNADYNAAVSWAASCVRPGYEFVGAQRAARLRAYQAKVPQAAPPPPAPTPEQIQAEEIAQKARTLADRLVAENATAAATPDPPPLVKPPVRKIVVQPAPRIAEPDESELVEHGSYTNVDGEEVHSPSHTVDGDIPDGATAECRDGSYSFSRHHRGTCSHHGGVSEWLN